MNNNLPLLSAIVVVGPCRTRAQRVINALGAQTVVESIEIIVVDLAPRGTPSLHASPNTHVTYLSRSEVALWSRARFEAIQHARAPVVAFIEDHCFPARDWAAALIETHKSSWVAVGYAFTNANPQTYLGRGGMVNDYGLWLHPAQGGAAALLPGNNVSYKRDVLLSFGNELEKLLTPDFNLQEILRERGLPMCIEPKALAAHQNFTRLAPLMCANYAYARLLAGRRSQIQAWSWVRRVLYGLLTPVSAPTLGTLRLLLSLRGRRSLVPMVLAGLPVYTLTHLWSAVGEAVGYLFGEGTAEHELNRWEIEFQREDSP